MKKLLILFSVLIGLNIEGFTQDTHWIANDSIDFSIIYRGSEINNSEKTIIPAKYLILIELEEYQKTTLNNLSVDNWKCLLESEESDFAAILILYSISKKDAILLQRITKTEWAKFYKEKDIEYFMDILQTDVTHEQSNISIAVVL